MIVDAPPVLPVPDALTIGRWVDGAVLAVRFDDSRYPLVERANAGWPPSASRSWGPWSTASGGPRPAITAPTTPRPGRPKRAPWSGPEPIAPDRGDSGGLGKVCRFALSGPDRLYS